MFIGLQSRRWSTVLKLRPYRYLPVFILFCLVVFNYLLSKFWSSIQLLPSEWLTIYAMLVVSTSIALYGMLQDLFVLIVHPLLVCHWGEWVERTLFSLCPVVVYSQTYRDNINRILPRKFQFLPEETSECLAKASTGLDGIYIGIVIYVPLSQHLGS